MTDPTPTYLHPTPTRRRLLRDALEGLPATGRAAEYEMARAGWFELPMPESGPWQVTAYGRAIGEVRVLDFGVDVPVSSAQLLAEVGDPDAPRVLGHVVYLPGRTRFRWQVTVGGDVEVVRDRRLAWAELWHRACLAYAAAPPIANP